MKYYVLFVRVYVEKGIALAQIIRFIRRTMPSSAMPPLNCALHRARAAASFGRTL